MAAGILTQCTTRTCLAGSRRLFTHPVIPFDMFQKKCSNLGAASVVFSGPSKRGFHGKN